jgi:DNA polymerase III delta prime subunit
MATINRLWVEKYRPKTLDEVIFQSEEQKKKFLGYRASKAFPNLLLSGTQGSGKTTIAKALIRDLGIDRADVLYVNASKEGIDAVREKIEGFVRTMPLGDFRVVRLEEFDYFSLSAQGALREITEIYSDTARFILTCNYENKIMPAIKSRVSHYRFASPAVDEVLLRMGEILFAENIDFDPDDLEKVVNAQYPDIRATIAYLEDNSKTGKLICSAVNTGSTSDYKFVAIDLLKAKKFEELRKLVRTSVPKEEYEDFFRLLYDGIKLSYKTDPSKLEESLITLNDFVFKHSVVTLPELNMEALLISLGRI